MLTITPIVPGTGAGLNRPPDITAGGRRKYRFNIAMDNNYPTGGYAITPANLNFAEQIDFLDIVNENINAWSAIWNRATQKIQLVVMSTGAEVANATDVHTFNCDVAVEGL